MQAAAGKENLHILRDIIIFPARPHRWWQLEAAFLKPSEREDICLKEPVDSLFEQAQGTTGDTCTYTAVMGRAWLKLSGSPAAFAEKFGRHNS